MHCDDNLLLLRILQPTKAEGQTLLLEVQSHQSKSNFTFLQESSSWFTTSYRFNSAAHKAEDDISDILFGIWDWSVVLVRIDINKEKSTAY